MDDSFSGLQRCRSVFQRLDEEDSCKAKLSESGSSGDVTEASKALIQACVLDLTQTPQFAEVRFRMLPIPSHSSAFL